MSKVLIKADLSDWPLVSQGKVRDTYELEGDRLLVVATDRISALDVVLPNGVPGKGEVLARLSAWWFQQMESWDIPQHFIDVIDYDNEIEHLGRRIPSEYHGRSMIVRKAEPLKAECIVRGYITGSGWKDYLATGEVCGIQLPEGLEESQELPEPIFAPSTKADVGHDDNISLRELAAMVGQAKANLLKTYSGRAYSLARGLALKRSIIIADTKFEFGEADGEIILIDEVLTPDSSRFWPLEGYQSGKRHPSLDKQPVRDWMLEIGWKDGDPPPRMPSQLIEETSERYRKIYKLLTGEEI